MDEVKEETNNDENFSKTLASLGDIFINDAFSCSHRKQSSIHKITKFVRISGFVNSNPEFTEQPKVINAASDLLVEIFGDMAKHSRIAVGVASLPLNSTVEIDMVVEFST